jgi:hypothetical protein
VITVVSNISDGTLAVYGLGVVGLVLLGRGAWIALDLLVDSMRHHSTLDQRAHDARRLVQAGQELPEIPAAEEPWWPGKTLYDSAARRLSVVADGPATFDVTAIDTSGVLPAPETPAETSGRHAKVEADDAVTGLMGAVARPAVVDDERPTEPSRDEMRELAALAVVAVQGGTL